MARLIDAESPQNRIYVSDLVIEEMKKIPTVDIDRPASSQLERMAVRCGDCKYSTLPSVQTQIYGKPGTRTCHNKKSPCNRRNVFSDDFCRYGERKNDANEPNRA